MEYYLSSPYGYALTEAQRKSVNYGLDNIPYWSSRMLGNMLNFWFGIDTSSANQPEIGIKPEYWSYKRPSTAFRLSDLIENPSNPSARGYFGRALPPLGNIKRSRIEVSPGGSMTFEFAKNEEGVSAGLTVRYEDLQMGGYSVYNMYFGFALWNRKTRASEMKLYTLTQNDPMSSFQEMGASVHTFTDDADIEGDYYIFPFASEDCIQGVQHSTDVYKMTESTNIRSSYIALVEPESVHISIRWADVKVLYLSSYIDQSHTNTIRTAYTLVNNMTDYPVTITKITLQYLKEDYTVDYTQELITPIRMSSGSTYPDTTAHDFGSTGARHIKHTRMIIETVEGVVFFSSAASAAAADVTEGPSPEA